MGNKAAPQDKAFRFLTDPKLFGVLLFINISIIFLGIYSLCISPVILSDHKTPLQIEELKIRQIEGIQVDESFFYRLPEFFFPKEERQWWRMQEDVYMAIIESNPVDIEYKDRDGINKKIEANVGYISLIEAIKRTGLIYLAAAIYLISAVSVFRRHHSPSGSILVLFLIFGSLYLISSAPVVSRQITLPPQYLKILIKFIYISTGGMITLVHFAFVFPRQKEKLNRFPLVLYIIFYGYFLITTTLYFTGVIAFGATFPIMCFWIIVMLGAFIHSILRESDIFLRKQISLSLFAPLIASTVFAVLNVLPGVLGTTSMNFTYFALFSLIMPYALPSAMENLRLYHERLEMEKNTQMEKERTRQELHDNLINDLTNIRFLSEAAEMSISKEPEKTRYNIMAIKDIALKNMEQFRDFLWAINVEERGIEDILSQFKTYNARLLDSLDIDIGYREIHSSNMPRLNTHIRFNLFNIFKEAMTNIIKHSMAKNVMVDIFHNEKGFEMRISDDGIGFNLENKLDGSYGLKNMKKRAEEMEGILNIISKEGKGTEISLILPPKYLI